MRCFFLATVLAICFITPNAMFADEVDNGHGPAEHAGQSGLVFGFDGERLFAFDGAMVAVRKQFCGRTAVRLGLSLGLESLDTAQDQSAEYEDTYPDTVLVALRDRTADGEDRSRDIEVDLVVIRHAESTRGLHLFGPEFAHHYSQSTDLDVEEEDETLETVSTTTTRRSWRYGLRLLVGVEWFVAESISLHAEYGAGLAYTEVETESDQIRELERPEELSSDRRSVQSMRGSTDGWVFADRGARFGATFFF